MLYSRLAVQQVSLLSTYFFLHLKLQIHIMIILLKFKILDLLIQIVYTRLLRLLLVPRAIQSAELPFFHSEAIHWSPSSLDSQFTGCNHWLRKWLGW